MSQVVTTPAAQVKRTALPGRVVRRALRLPLIGQWATAAVRAIGQDERCRRWSKHSKYVPDVVDLHLPGTGGRPAVTGRMYSAGGNDHIVREIWLHGLAAYELPVPRLYVAALVDGGLVLDVGANSGLYAVLAARANPTVRVASYEPFPKALHWLGENLRLNGVADRVTVVPAALGAEAGTADFYVPAKQFGETLETSASLNRHFRAEHSEVLKVPVHRADDDVAGMAPGRVCLLRVDVEGAEHLVLAGAAATLRDHRPLVMTEVLSEGAAAELEPIRAAADYAVLALEADRVVSLPGVRRVAASPNLMWYPREQRDRVVALTAELGLAWAERA